MTQTDRVLRHLQDYGSITPVEAMAEYGIMRLGARIWDLKRQGHVIFTERETGVNRYGEKTAYARYSLRRSRSEPASAGARRQDAGETRACQRQ